jgi:hypothetical protein
LLETSCVKINPIDGCRNSAAEVAHWDDHRLARRHREYLPEIAASLNSLKRLGGGMYSPDTKKFTEFGVFSKQRRDFPP